MTEVEFLYFLARCSQVNSAHIRQAASKRTVFIFPVFFNNSLNEGPLIGLVEIFPESLMVGQTTK